MVKKGFIQDDEAVMKRVVLMNDEAAKLFVEGLRVFFGQSGVGGNIELYFDPLALLRQEIQCQDVGVWIN